MLVRVLVLCLIVLIVQACVSPGPTTEQVLVAPLSDEGSSSASGMTREELEDHVRRYADRYFTRIFLAANELSEQTESIEHRRLMHNWKSISQTAIVDMAVGPNAVTNLLDMIVATRLSRLVVESYWVPEIFGEELGVPFLNALVDLENDIWSIADDVLSPQHQQDLRALIDEWHAENPEQVYPWYVRLSDFSGQRSASLAAVQQSGGLLSEVARAREAAEEFQSFGERLLYYLQRAPMITTNELESGVSEMLQNPEITRILDDTEQLVASIEHLVQIIDDLPDERIELIDQFMDRVAIEREEMLADVSETEPELRALLVDLRPVIESLERLVVAAKGKNPDSKPFDINEYRALVAESSVTATELRLLIEAISKLAKESQEATPFMDKLLEVEQAAIQHAFWYSVALILIFFTTLLIYRVIQRRFLPN